jgi:hypothetical protein
MVDFNTWKPTAKPNQAEQTQRYSGKQAFGPGINHVIRNLTSNPAYLKSMTDKFKIQSAREAGESTAAHAAGASGLAEGMSDLTQLGGAGSRRHRKEEVCRKVRRAKPGAIQRLQSIAPALGGAAGSPEVSGGVGAGAGLRELRRGGGVLGAIVARQLGLAAGDQPASQPNGAGRTPRPAQRGPAVFFNNVHQPTMLSPAPAPARARAGSGPAALCSIGQQRLSEVLQARAGGVGDLLQGSNVGRMLKAVEGLQDALSTRAADRLQAERYFLRF